MGRSRSSLTLNEFVSLLTIVLLPVLGRPIIARMGSLASATASSLVLNSSNPSSIFSIYSGIAPAGSASCISFIRSRTSAFCSSISSSSHSLNRSLDKSTSPFSTANKDPTSHRGRVSQVPLSDEEDRPPVPTPPQHRRVAGSIHESMEHTSRNERTITYMERLLWKRLVAKSKSAHIFQLTVRKLTSTYISRYVP